MKYTIPKINSISKLLNAILVEEDKDIGGIFKYVGHITDILEERAIGGPFSEVDIDIEFKANLDYVVDNMQILGWAKIPMHPGTNEKAMQGDLNLILVDFE